MSGMSLFSGSLRAIGSAASMWLPALGALGLNVAMPARAFGQQPHADVPLPAPLFSIDRDSPTSAQVGANAVLTKPGPGVLFPASGLNLSSNLDDIDGLSFGKIGIGPGQQFLLLFSVDRASVGGAPPDATLAGTGKRFNVQDQAARNQEAGDMYVTLDAFTRAGVVSPPPGDNFVAGPAQKENNTLAINQGDTGGVDFDLRPNANPLNPIPDNESIDDTNASTYGSSSPSPIAALGVDPAENPLFFTVSRDSPSLPNIVKGQSLASGADIFADADRQLPGSESFFVTAAQLGLVPDVTGDDIDALLVFDNGNGVFDPGTDQVLFSLAPGSPTLVNGGFSAADIFSSFGLGAFDLYADANLLGLDFGDNVDALEIVLTADADQTASDVAIFEVLPGDVNGDGVLDLFECAQFQDCFTGDGVPYQVQQTHVVDVGPGVDFVPADIDIVIGDTVLWTWVGGLHNVVSGPDGIPDGIFSSGAPTNVNGTAFEVTFDAPFVAANPMPDGTYSYFCEVHVDFGMVGTVTVGPDPCAPLDLDLDGDIDCRDWRFFQLLIEDVSGTRCPPLPLADFVNAVLCIPNRQAHLCMADMNLDGEANGLDIRLYIDALIGDI